jgi:gliding motility-associated-like protein
LCSSGLVDFTVNGGTLGTLAQWELLEDSCSGNLIATSADGSFPSIAVTESKSYFVNAKGYCNSTNCVSNDFVLATNSQNPSSLLISDDTLCSSALVDFTVNGGSLGTLAQWEILEDSCSGNLIATSADGSFSSIAVTESKSYFVNAKGFCDTTNCVNVDFVMATHSQNPTSLLISEDTLCSASDVNFNVSGGVLGTLAQWELLEDSCSGNLIANSNDGTFSNVEIVASKAYFVNAKGLCDTTNCVFNQVIIGTQSSTPNTILFSDSVICQGATVDLQIIGGNLGTNGEWKWYKDSCSGSSIADGDTITLTQNITTNYFVRAEGLCDTTACINKTIVTPPHYIDLDSLSMDSLMNPTDSSWYIPDSVCPQSAVKLFAHYTGEFPFSYSITWYENSCGSTPIDVGDSIIVYPDSTTTYYARVIGTCGASLCKSITVKTKDGSLSATGIIASANNFCTGGSTTLSVVGGLLGQGAQWAWYKGTCSGTAVGTGSSISVTPASTTTYFVRANGGNCGSTSCTSILINTYDLNMYHSPLDPTCESAEIILEGGFPLGGSYSGLGVIDSLFDPSITGIGTQTITYTYIDGNNCIDSIQTSIDVLQHNPDPILLSASSYEICNGNSTTLSLDTNSTLIAGSKWVWYEEACATGTIIDTTENLDTLWVNQVDSSYSSVNFTQISPSTTTNYYVRSEGGECPPSNCIGVTIDVYTLETNLNSFEKVCGIATPSFDLTGGIPSGGIYSGNGVTNNHFYPILADTGSHAITYTYTVGQCIATDQEVISIEASPLNLYHSIEQETCAEGGIMIHIHAVNGAGFYNYKWSDGSFENPLTYANSSYYNVLVADGNNCYTFLDSIIIDTSLTCIEMVNTFSPNGDGLNDNWVLDFTNYESASLTIFNKWGNELIQFNETIISWDGMFEGSSLPSGTYYYIVTLTESSGNEIQQSGPITILR